MSKKIKLIWEFRGPSAEQTAKHHVIHLKEYMQIEKFDFEEANHSVINEFSAFAFLITNEDYLQKLRADLKPNKGQYYTPKTNE
ncbi:hypothetical protein [Pseudofulvibacter geojedonensis]|uniref:Uncharacterized protein n=1 Tax=Pseudofulvibacter geojedonensis TaxID=1123758 RepID=A0ABW3I108_9FLAO